MSYIPSLEQARELLMQYNKETFHLQHAETVSKVVGEFAKEYDSDNVDFWRSVGMLHDIDFELYPEQHCLKANEILQKIPVRFGDRMYWEAEIDYANKEYDTALLKCRASFSRMARFVSRCIRIARDIYIVRENKYDLAGQLEYDEYMYRIVDAFMSGGNYLPCRQIFHKYGMLHDIAEKCIKLGRFDRAVECAEMLFEGRAEFVRFLKAPQNCKTLLFEDNDAFEDQREIRELVDHYMEETAENLKKIPDYKKNQRIMALLEKYELL